MRILHRYVLTELVRVFILALLAFTAIFVLGGLVHEAGQQGLGPVQILRIVPFVVPASLPFTIPATLLLAVTVVYGRLAADNEVMATKAAGINVFYLLVPGFGLAIGLSFFTLILHDRIIPAANLRMRTALVSNVEQLAYTVLKKEGMLKAPGSPYEIYVQRVEGRKLINTTFKKKGPEGNYDMIAYAQEAELKFDLEKKIVDVHMHMAEVTDGKGVRIEAPGDKIFPISLPNIGNVNKGVRDMTIRDIERQKVELMRGQERNCGQWVFDSLGPIFGGHLEQVQWGAIGGLVEKRKSNQRTIWRLSCEPNMRRAIAFGCLAFVFLGCPMAILFQRGDYLSAFISCFMPIILLYYPLVMFGFNLSKEGIAPPIVIWSGNIMLAILALIAYRPVLKH